MADTKRTEVIHTTAAAAALDSLTRQRLRENRQEKLTYAEAEAAILAERPDLRPADGPEPEPITESELPPRWRYKVIATPGVPDETVLNDMAAEGWELVTAIWSAGLTIGHAVFKRPA